METREEGGVRRVIVGVWVACLAVLMTPWLTGGREPLALLLSGFALLLATLLAWRQPAVRRLGRGFLGWSYVGYVGVAALSLIWTASRFYTLQWLVLWVMAGLAFWLAYVVAGERDGRRLVVRVYLATAVIFSLAAIGMYGTSDYDRLTGWFYWPNPAATYLMPAVLLVLAGVRGAHTNRSMGGWMALAILFCSTFLLTSSRAAILVLGLVTVIYLLLISLRHGLWIKYLFILAVSIGVSIGVAWLSVQLGHERSDIVPGTRSAEVEAGTFQSGADRMEYLRSAFEMWFDHPLGGVGAGAYGVAHPEYQRQVVSAADHAHNLYVQTLAELGLVGAMILASVLFWLLIGCVRGLFSAPEMVPVFLGLVAMLLHFGLDTGASYPSLLFLAAVLAGLVFHSFRERRAPARWWWPLTAALVLVPAISLYQSDVWVERGRAAQADEDQVFATEAYERARSVWLYDPDVLSAEGIGHLALAYGSGDNARRELNRTLDLAREAQRLDPHDGQHHQLEGRALVRLNRPGEAEAAFKRALVLDRLNQPGYALDLALVQRQQGGSTEAKRTVEAMLALYPERVIENRSVQSELRQTLAGLYALLANLELSAGQSDEADKAVRRSLELDPHNLPGRAIQHQLQNEGVEAP
jgi:tetratricopeptide (TPR) repeat protein